MHLVLEVQANKAVEGTAERMAEDLKETLRNERIPFESIKKVKSWDIQVQLPSANQQEALRKVLDKSFPSLEWKNAETSGQGSSVMLTMKSKYC